MAEGGIHGKGACVAGGCAWQGACVAGGGACVAGKMAIAVGSMYPTGMQNLFILVFPKRANSHLNR